MAKDTDSASSLEELMPMVLMPYAIYVPAFDPYGSPHYKQPYRRYATKSHMKTGAKGIMKIYGQVKLFEFNFDTDTWEEYND